MTTFTVGCYGKLPLHGDFIRQGATTPELSLLDTWIQTGIVSARQSSKNFDDSFDHAPASRFIYCCPPTQRMMAGIIMPGCDKVGRQYPFMLFTYAPLSLFGPNYPLAPAIFEDFFTRAHAVATHWIGLDLKTFISKVEGLSFTADVASTGTKFSINLAHAPIHDLWHATFGSHADTRKYLILHNLAEVIKPNFAPKYALRLPQAPSARELAFWLELTRRMGARKVPPTLTVWTMPKDKTDAAVTLVFEDLQPKYFLPLLQPAIDSDSVYCPAKTGVGDEKRLAAAKQKHGRHADGAGMNIGDLLDAYGRV